MSAFLYGIDKLNSEPGEGLRLIYVSPLQALTASVFPEPVGVLNQRVLAAGDRRPAQGLGGIAQHRGALLLRRVAGADADAELRLQPGQRPAQVALDVVPTK
jgi:hypothetical protein